MQDAEDLFKTIVVIILASVLGLAGLGAAWSVLCRGGVC